MLNMSVNANRCLSKNDNKTITNSVDPDETARNDELSHQDLHCLQKCVIWSACLKMSPKKMI